MKSFLLAILFLFCLIACDDNNGIKEQAAQEIIEKASEKQKAINRIKNQILEENDYEGRLWKGLATLQDNYNLSASEMPSLGTVVVDLIDMEELVIKNEIGEDVFETKVKLKSLQSTDTGFRLLADEQPGEFPGLSIRTINDDPVIYEYKNGTLQNKNNELTIYLKDRDAIGNIAPALLQTLRIANEMN